LALALARAGVALPAPLATTVHLLSQACIPLFLVILGLQLRASRALGPRAPLAVAVGMRLVAGPLLALGLAPLFGLEGTPHQAAVLQSAMPSAVICTVLAAEYDAAPGFVTAAVFLTTLLSPLTLTPLLAYLGA
jgi:predicted permease